MKAHIYARISNNSERSENSIENQIAVCEDFIRRHGGLGYGGVFIDLGYSGTNFKRPGFGQMMAGILTGEVKCLMVKDLSRLGRSYIEVGELLFDTLMQNNVRFISVNDDYDSFCDEASRKKLLILFKNLVNHAYSRDLSRKIKSALDAKKKRGEPLGPAPYGYRYDTESKRLVAVPEQIEIIRIIFEKRQKGMNLSGIARYLNEKGIDSPKKVAWSAAYIGKVLKNRVYDRTFYAEGLKQDV
jgi:DNA invertase Pin-like site-specific DNA recombinase